MITTLVLTVVAWLGAEEVSTKFIASGAAAKVGGYRPIRAEMDGAAELAKVPPDGLAAPKYGTLKIGDKSWVFILDEPDGTAAKLYVDTNNDGDFTNDPATQWRSQTVGEITQHSGRVQVDLGDGQLASLGVYRFDPKDTRRAALKNTLMYYTDYGHELTLNLDGQKFTTFCELSLRSPLWIDRDQNKQRSSKLETVVIGTPFNFTGTTYVLRREGSQFRLETASDPLPMAAMPPDLRVGKLVLPFETTTMDGAKIDFPKSYQGKLVLLDFWATWCGPCIAELPNVKQAYHAWHDKGFEILGVSFDNAEMDDKVKEFLKQHELTWPQVYEGKGWQTALGELYDVSGIPFVLLVDGDSGEILATESNLREPGLSDFIGEQVAKKFGETETPFSPPKSEANLSSLRPAVIELISAPDMSRELATFQVQGKVSPSNYVPTNPAVAPLVSADSQAYSVEGGLDIGSFPYTDRRFKITELPDGLRGLTLLRTKMGHKGIVDGRFSIVLNAKSPCHVFVAIRDETLENYRRHGIPSWLQEYSATEFTLMTDNPIRGSYHVFVKQVPSGQVTLGPCCSDPETSSMYFAFAAEAR